MVDQDRARFAALITGVADYYRTPLSDFAIGLYWNGLRRYDIAAIEQALERHIARPDREGAFMPKVSDLTVMLDGRSGDQSAVAWAKVDRAVRTRGSYDDVVFDDALIHRVIADLGGWVWLGNQTDKEWPFIARDFQSRYQGYRMRGETPQYPHVLTGLGNSHNRNTGMPLLPAILVGDPERCRDVAKSGQLAIGAASTPARVALSLPEQLDPVPPTTERP